MTNWGETCKKQNFSSVVSAENKKENITTFDLKHNLKQIQSTQPNKHFKYYVNIWIANLQIASISNLVIIKYNWAASISNKTRLILSNFREKKRYQINVTFGDLKQNKLNGLTLFSSSRLNRHLIFLLHLKIIWTHCDWINFPSEARTFWELPKYQSILRH